ncbi:MAG: hypothetical protein LW884_08960 [Bacteroidetes bacterium]|nr:hypothetical protein [Bacteroidota bacterium]
MRLNLALFIFAVSLVASGCSVPEDAEVPKWEAEFLTPVLKSEFNLGDILSLAKLDIAGNYNLNTLGYGGIPVVIPPVSGQNRGPFPQTITNDFESVTLDSARIKLSITNNNPVNLRAGTALVLVNSDGETVYTLVLPRNLAPGQSYADSAKVANVRYTKEMRLSINNFGTDGSGGQVVQTTGVGLSVQYEVTNIIVKEIEFPALKTVPFSLTQAADINIDYIEEYSPEGFLITKITNRTNSVITVNVLFKTEENGAPFDSLFATRLQVGPGSAALPGISRDTVAVNRARYESITKNTRFVEIRGRTSIPPGASTRTFTLNETLVVQIIGDVKAIIDADL